MILHVHKLITTSINIDLLYTLNKHHNEYDGIMDRFSIFMAFSSLSNIKLNNHMFIFYPLTYINFIIQYHLGDLYLMAFQIPLYRLSCRLV